MSIVSRIYINDVYQGQTSGTSWNIGQIYTQTAPYGAGYYLPMPWATIMYWRVDTYDTETELTTTGDTWSFVTQNDPLADDDRGVWDGISGEWVDDYDPTDSWQFVDGEWQWTEFPDVGGGGRWRNNVLTFAVDENGLGIISVG